MNGVRIIFVKRTSGSTVIALVDKGARREK